MVHFHKSGLVMFMTKLLSTYHGLVWDVGTPCTESAHRVHSIPCRPVKVLKLEVLCNSRALICHPSLDWASFHG